MDGVTVFPRRRKLKPLAMEVVMSNMRQLRAYNCVCIYTKTLVRFPNHTG